jgi:hypothetical protein
MFKNATMAGMMTSRNVDSRGSMRSERPLTMTELRQVAPSLFASQAHESRSARFAFVPSNVILEGLMREGFMPMMATQGRSRIEGKADFTKHMVRLRQEGDIGKAEAKEVIWLNGHDGTAASQLWKGMFRGACSNGHVFGDVEDKVVVRHTGDAMRDVIDGCTRIIEDFTMVEQSMGRMKALDLSRPEQMLLASSALSLRFGHDQDGLTMAPVTADRLLTIQRFEDRSPDLWTTFNVVQENAVRGGLSGRSATGRRVRTRPVANIDGNMSLNRALWQLADGFAQLKTSGAIEGLKRLEAVAA